jgi:hypothetical protein
VAYFAFPDVSLAFRADISSHAFVRRIDEKHVVASPALAYVVSGVNATLVTDMRVLSRVITSPYPLGSVLVERLSTRETFFATIFVAIRVHELERVVVSLPVNPVHPDGGIVTYIAFEYHSHFTSWIVDDRR